MSDAVALCVALDEAGFEPLGMKVRGARGNRAFWVDAVSPRWLDGWRSDELATLRAIAEAHAVEFEIRGHWVRVWRA